MTTYNMYRYVKDGLAFIVEDREDSDFNAKYLTALTELLENGEIEFVEVFNSEEKLDAYVKENLITLWDRSKIQ